MSDLVPQTGVFPHEPEVRCLLLNEHTLCGDAIDLYSDVRGEDLDFVIDLNPLPITCSRCAVTVELVRAVRLERKLTEREEADP
jgi:hypothetical protein